MTNARPWIRPAERRAAGKAARATAPRRSHGDWEEPAGRRDPVDILEEQGRSRVQRLLPVRRGRMLADAFAFYRGSAAVMAADLARTPASGLTVQACGDAHLANFGLFATPERRLAFDLNDFDETLRAPFEWDVKRLAASGALAARVNGFSRSSQRAAARAAATGYRSGMNGFAEQGNLEVWYTGLSAEQLLDAAPPKRRKRAARGISKARRNDALRAVSKLTRRRGRERRIVSDPPLLVPVEEWVDADQAEELRAQILELLSSYNASVDTELWHLLEEFTPVDIAFKVVGVGSVGTRALIILMLGRDHDDYLLLQAKEAAPSVLAPFVDGAPEGHDGRRVVEGQRAMQAHSDIFLGWSHAGGRDYYVRQLKDMKGSFDPRRATAKGLARYVGVCGWVLARAHACTGDRLAIAGYLGRSDRFDRAIEAFGMSYADQAERDHAALGDAVEDGRLEAMRDL